jgi:hypothetical protein
MVAERAFQKEGRRGQRRERYKKKVGGEGVNLITTQIYAKGNTGGRIFGYLPADIAVEEDRNE